MRFWFVLPVLLLFCLQSRATHIVGGTIAYECLGFNANTNEMHVRIKMYVYRDAINGQAAFDNPAVVGIFTGNNPSTLYTTINMSNPVITNVPINTANPCMIVPPNIAVEQGYYQRDIFLPYNASGYHLSYQRCCRNNTISNVVLPSGATYTIFISGVAQQMCNSSPVFNNFPPPVICRNVPLSFDHSATDINGHTLVYEMCNPLEGGSMTNPAPNPPTAPNYANVVFSGGFNAGNPMPANPGLQINSTTGLLTGTPLQLGQYVVGICVSEFDANGNLLSRTLRDFQFNVALCESNIHAAVLADSVDPSGNNFFRRSCGSNTISFVNQSTDPALINSYLWRFTGPGGFMTTSSAVNPTITFPGPGTYNGILVPNPGQVGCSDTAFLTVVVLPVLTTALQVNVAPCAPASASVSFTQQTAGGAGSGYQYNWNFGNGQTSTAANPSFSYGNNVGNYTISLNVTDAQGCTATATGSLAWFPPQSINISHTFAGCLFDTLRFTNNSLPAAAGYTYAWNFGNGATSAQASPSYVYPVPGTYNVQMVSTSPTGCTATYANTFVVNAPPVASFTMTYDSCTYAPVQFASTSTPSGSPLVSWAWDFQNGDTGSGATTQYLYPLAGTYPVRLIVTDANGCRDTVQQNIQWYPRPVIAVNIPPGVGCAPYTMLFDNQSYPINGYTTQWNFGDGNSSTQASPVHTYQNPGSYHVTLLITSPLNCQATFEDTIEIFPRPNAAFTATFDLCAIAPVHFNESSTPSTSGSPLVQWQWNFGDGTPLLLAGDTSHLYGLAGNFNVELVVTDAQGCTDTARQVVAWHPAPIVAVDVSDSIGCQPLVVNFVNNSYPINGYTTTWTFGDGGSSPLASPVHVYQQHGTFLVHLHIVSPTGCLGDFYDTVTVWQKPLASFYTSYDSCSISEVRIFDTAQPNQAGTPLTLWDWQFGNGSGGQFGTSFGDTVVNYTPLNTYQLQLVVQDANGCRDTLQQTLNYFPAPVFPVASHSLTGCAPQTIAFTNHPNNNAPGYGSVWNFGNGQTSTVFDTTVVYPERGVYYASLTVTSAAGCVQVFRDTIRINGNPVAHFTINYDSCALNGPVELMNASIASPDGILTQWLWTFGDGSGGTNYKETHYYADTGTYTVTMRVTDANGCTDDTTKTFGFYPQPVYPVVLTDSRGCVPLFIDNPNNTPYPKAGYTLSWSYGDGRTSNLPNPPDYYYEVPGSYVRQVIIRSPIGCVDTFRSNHTALPVPIAAFTFSPAEVTSYNPLVHFTDQSIAAAAWHWTFGEGNAQSYQQNPSYTYIDTGRMQVQLVVKHLNGCTDTAVQVVDVVPFYTFFLPNAFTPNNDGKNDGYRGNGIFEYISDFEMQIYNRWGELIFRTDSPYEAWNGRKNNTGELCQAGVYVVMVRFRGGRDGMKEIKGFATIIY